MSLVPKTEIVGDIAKDTTGVIKAVYEDTFQPATRQVGHVIGSAAQLVLAPLRMVLDGGNGLIARLQKRIEAKTEGIPSARLLAPPAHVAGPALMNYLLLGDDPEAERIRSMYENLIASAMDSDKVSAVHPAFVRIVEQLAPDEAKMLSSSILFGTGGVPVFAIRRYVTGSNEYDADRHDWGEVCELGLELGIDWKKQLQYMTNLHRLGLLNKGQAAGHAYEESYNRLVAHYGQEIEKMGLSLDNAEDILWPTEFGAEFVAICLGKSNDCEVQR